MNEYQVLKGKVTGSTVKAVGTAGKMVRHLTVQFSDADDAQVFDALMGAGVDACPPTGSTVFLGVSGETKRSVIATRDGVTPTAAEGDYEVYSSDGATKKGRVRAKADGTLYLANVPGGVNLRTALVNLVQGIQGMTCVNGSPPVDTTTKIATALTQLSTLLAASE